MSQQNKTQLQSTINTNVADNTVGDISAADIRNPLIDLTDSLLFNSGSQTFDGTLTATAFVGDGSSITGVTGEWDGTLNGNAEITGSLIVSSSVVDFTDATAISGSTFSGSFVGDGSGLTGVTGEWDGTLDGNAEITGSLTASGSVVDFTDATAISGSTFSGSFVGDGSGLTLPSTSGTAKIYSGVFTEVTGGSPALALTTERNDFDSTSPLIATRLGAGYWQFTFSGGAFDSNSSSTVYSFQPTPANSTVSVGFYSADTQAGNVILIYARDTSGAMADGVLGDVEFRITQFTS